MQPQMSKLNSAGKNVPRQTHLSVGKAVNVIPIIFDCEVVQFSKATGG